MNIKYTNENICKQVKGNLTFFRLIIANIIISVLLIALGPFLVYMKHKDRNPIPFDALEASNKHYFAELTKMPEHAYNNLYKAEIDGRSILISISESKLNELENNGSVSLHGRLSAYNSDIYFETFDYYFYGELVDDYPVGPIFGITGLIIWGCIMHMSGTLLLFRHFHPGHGSTKYSIEEIDGQANMKSAEWLDALGVYLAPKIMIGTQKGVMAVEYADIARIKIRGTAHSERKKSYKRKPIRLSDNYIDSENFLMIVKTKKGNSLTFSETKYPGAYKRVEEKVREHNPEVEIIDPFNEA